MSNRQKIAPSDKMDGALSVIAGAGLNTEISRARAKREGTTTRSSGTTCFAVSIVYTQHKSISHNQEHITTHNHITRGFAALSDGLLDAIGADERALGAAGAALAAASRSAALKSATDYKVYMQDVFEGTAVYLASRRVRLQRQVSLLSLG